MSKELARLTRVLSLIESKWQVVSNCFSRHKFYSTKHARLLFTERKKDSYSRISNITQLEWLVIYKESSIP